MGVNFDTNSDSFENVGFSAGLNWRPADDILAYLKAAQGLQAEGFNLISATPERFDILTWSDYVCGVARDTAADGRDHSI